ncbi:MAG: alternative ribosome rescue aminoacyl-tRNA hydrolase ArfB [Candidatus Latescibacterota bacterium]
MDALTVAPDLVIPAEELRFTFDRSPGPGGQNVNKTNTRAELRFDVVGSPSLTEEQRARLVASLGGGLTQAGLLIVRSARFRSQRRNREDCLARFRALLAELLKPPPPRRRPTRPGRAAVGRRLAKKRHHSEKKALRRFPLT